MENNTITMSIYHRFSARNKNHKLVGRFFGDRIFYRLLIDIPLKYTRNLADQNGFWSAKCWNWSENHQWLTVIFSTAGWDKNYLIYFLRNNIYVAMMNIVYNGENCSKAIYVLVLCNVGKWTLLLPMWLSTLKKLNQNSKYVLEIDQHLLEMVVTLPLQMYTVNLHYQIGLWQTVIVSSELP